MGISNEQELIMHLEPLVGTREAVEMVNNYRDDIFDTIENVYDIEINRNFISLEVSKYKSKSYDSSTNEEGDLDDTLDHLDLPNEFYFKSNINDQNLIYSAIRFNDKYRASIKDDSTNCGLYWEIPIRDFKRYFLNKDFEIYIEEDQK